jgi:molybdate transport system substrate-binding protein
MRVRCIAAAIAIMNAGLIFLFVQEAPAHAAEIRLISSNGVKAVVEELRPQAERSSGRQLTIDFGTASALKQKIEAGAAFDVAILTTEAIDDLIKEGKIAAGTRADLTRSGIGVGIRTGAPKPDIRTPDALKRTLLKAKSITYAQDGASRVYLEQMFDHLGITEAVKPKLILEQGSARSGAKVANGEAEIIMTLISEILPIQGIELVGPLPKELQNYVSFAAGVSPKANDMESAKALIKFFTSPAAAPTFKAKGMEHH